MPNRPESWLADLAAADADLHATLAGRSEHLARAAWSRRVVEAQAALGQARATIALQDRLLHDLATRHTELEAEVHALHGTPAADSPESVAQAGAEQPVGQPPSRLRIALTDPARALRAVRRRLPGGHPESQQPQLRLRADL